MVQKFLQVDDQDVDMMKLWAEIKEAVAADVIMALQVRLTWAGWTLNFDFSPEPATSS